MKKKTIACIFFSIMEKPPLLFNTGYDGSKVWSELHRIVENIPCGSCSVEGQSLLNAMHDIINLRLGKPIYDLKNMKFFMEELIPWVQQQWDQQNPTSTVVPGQPFF